MPTAIYWAGRPGCVWYATPEIAAIGQRDADQAAEDAPKVARALGLIQ